MAGKKDYVITISVPGLSRRMANQLKNELINTKNKIAPNAKGSIVVAEKKKLEQRLRALSDGK